MKLVALLIADLLVADHGCADDRRGPAGRARQNGTRLPVLVCLTGGAGRPDQRRCHQLEAATTSSWWAPDCRRPPTAPHLARRGDHAPAARESANEQSATRLVASDRRKRTCPEPFVVSMGGCIASALTGESAVEVVGAILGTVDPRAGRALAAVAARRVTAADRPPDGQARPLDTGLCAADRWRAAAPTTARSPIADRSRAGWGCPALTDRACGSVRLLV
jgi:hypothetical protein